MIFKREKKNNSIKDALSKLRIHRGLSDCLTFLTLLDDHTILHKDGALSRHFRYVAPDLDSSTDPELDFHADTWSQSFQFLGNGWMVETNVVSLPFQGYAKPHEFPSVVSALIDDERRQQFHSQHYFQTHYYISITWKPDSLMNRKLRQFAIDNAGGENTSAFSDQLETFNQRVNEWIGFLQRSLLTVDVLKGDSLLSFLHHCISGHAHGLKQPELGCFLDSYLSSEDFVAGFHPCIGKKHIKVLALDDLPTYSFPGILDALSYFPMNYRWSSRFIPLDRITAAAYLKRYERNWSSKAIGVMGILRESMGFSAKRDEDAQQTAEQLKFAQTANSGGGIGYGFYNSNLILMHEDLQYLEKMSDDIILRIQQMEYKVRDESVNATEAFLGAIPSHGDYNLRKIMLDTRYLGHALPTSSVYQGELHAPCPLKGYANQPALLVTGTRGNRPFMLNLHVGDVGHTAILGPTGKGKTTLNALLMASHRKYPGSRIIVLDKDYSNRIPIKALGGDYFDLSKKECQLGVFSQLKPDDSEQIDKGVDWLVDICTVQGVSIRPAQRKCLREAVLRLAHEKPEYKNLDHLSVQEPELREAIQIFNSGRFHDLLNGTESLISQSDVIGFEMGELLSNPGKAASLNLPVIKAIFNELDELFRDKRPTLLVLEEAWLYLKHDLFREKLTDWFKTLRKANVAVIFISQDLDDIVQSDAVSVIQTSCMTRIYLANAAATEPHIAGQYQAFGLNNRQIEIIQQAIPKRDYYYHSELGTRLFRLDLGVIAKAFLCVNDKEKIQQFDATVSRENSEWVLEWLKINNLHEAAEFVSKHYFGYSENNREPVMAPHDINSHMAFNGRDERERNAPEKENKNA